jgi:hypothetical protein
VSQSLELIDGFYRKLDSFYVRPLPANILRKAVDGMTNSLDQ